MKILYDPAALQGDVAERCEPNYCSCNGEYNPCSAQTCGIDSCGAANVCWVNCPPNDCPEVYCGAFNCLANAA